MLTRFVLNTLVIIQKNGSLRLYVVVGHICSGKHHTVNSQTHKHTKTLPWCHIVNWPQVLMDFYTPCFYFTPIVKYIHPAMPSTGELSL